MLRTALAKAVVFCAAALLAGQCCQAQTPAGSSQLTAQGPLGRAESADCRGARSLAPGADVCSYVRENCAKGSVIPYVELYYCYVRSAGLGAVIAYQVACALWLLLLFRTLGSTAENFFSPILTQISQEMGLPPRFAGVTFLALGNGAPDISSSIAAIRAGNFEMALGALLGGGLFVGGVVAGVVMLANGGAKARGALLRDVGAYAAAVGLLTAFLASGAMTLDKSAALLAMYGGFVLLVLGADLWHICFGRKREADKAAPEQAEPLLLDGAAVQGAGHMQPAIPPAADLYAAPQQHEPPHHDQVLDSSIELTEKQHSMGSAQHSPEEGAGRRQPSEAMGADEHEALPHHRVQQWLAAEGNHLLPARTYRARALAEVARSVTFERRGRGGARRRASLDACALEEEEQEDAERPASRGPGYEPPQLEDAMSQAQERQAGAAQDLAELGAASSVQQQAGVGSGHRRGRLEGDGALGEPQASRADSVVNVGRFRRAVSRCKEQLDKASPVLAALARVADAAELPLVVLRRATVPVLDPEFYDRHWFLASLAFGPVFAAWYLHLGWQWWAGALCVGCVAAATATWATRSAKDTPPAWSCGLRFPVGAASVAALGFTLAAMWIDTIASELVALLEYLGLLSGINHTVLGLTVLAWGNSIGDMSTNLAMARKGLANMAMTACYAGPVFNLLVGASVGFLRLLAARGVRAVRVEATRNVVLSCACALVMCAAIAAVGLANGCHLPAKFGWFLIGLYTLYVIASVILVLV